MAFLENAQPRALKAEPFETRRLAILGVRFVALVLIRAARLRRYWRLALTLRPALA